MTTNLNSNILVTLVGNHPIVLDLLQKIISSNQDLRYRISHCSKARPEAEYDCNLLVLDAHSLPQWMKVVSRWQGHGDNSIIVVGPQQLTPQQELSAVYLGVHGIVEFSCDLSRDLLRAMYSVAQGKFWVRRDVLNEYVRCTQRSPRASGSSLEQHTVRQEQIISLIGEGLSNKEIADILGISERTVKFHISNLLQKYQVDNRRKLLVKAALPKSTHPGNAGYVVYSGNCT